MAMGDLRRLNFCSIQPNIYADASEVDCALLPQDKTLDRVGLVCHRRDVWCCGIEHWASGGYAEFHTNKPSLCFQTIKCSRILATNTCMPSSLRYLHSSTRAMKVMNDEFLKVIEWIFSFLIPRIVYWCDMLLILISERVLWLKRVVLFCIVYQNLACIVSWCCVLKIVWVRQIFLSDGGI